MLRNLVDSLIVNNRIETTVSKAKELRILADRMITLGKDGSLSAKRRALKFLRTKDAFIKLFSEYSEKFKDRNGGYTRIIKTRLRHGDNAQLAYIEYVEEAVTAKITKKKRRRSKKSTELSDSNVSEASVVETKNNETSDAETKNATNSETSDVSSNDSNVDAKTEKEPVQE